MLLFTDGVINHYGEHERTLVTIAGNHPLHTSCLPSGTIRSKRVGSCKADGSLRKNKQRERKTYVAEVRPLYPLFGKVF